MNLSAYVNNIYIYVHLIVKKKCLHMWSKDDTINKESQENVYTASIKSHFTGKMPFYTITYPITCKSFKQKNYW